MAMSSPPGVAHIAQAGVGGFQRESPGAVDLAEYRHLVAANLDERDVDLGLLDETAFLQRICNLFLGPRNRKAAQLHRANQRVGDGAIF